jgi:hypothetical protein
MFQAIARSPSARPWCAFSLQAALGPAAPFAAAAGSAEAAPAYRSLGRLGYP